MFSIWCSPAEIFGAPKRINIYCLQKKEEKKGRHYFLVFKFYYRLFAPLIGFWRPPRAFFTPKYLPYHRTLIWPTYGSFLQPNNFNSKFWRPLLMAPPSHSVPFSWHPLLMAPPSHGAPFSWRPLLMVSPSHGAPFSWRPLLMAPPSHGGAIKK